MKIIGLTGGIASGKSTVSNMLKKLGGEIFDADKTAHLLLQPQNPVYKEIVEEFVEKRKLDILNANNAIDRKKLGDIVFKNKDLLNYLESFMHKHIEKAADEFIKKAKDNGDRVVFLDVPLLIEKNWQTKVDKIWLVYVDKDIQIQRLVNRDNTDKIQAQLRLDNQMPLKNKLTYAQTIIDNNGDIENTEKQVIAAWQKLNQEL